MGKFAIADEIKALTKAVENGSGGGGNPNYVERIAGTVINPWGDCQAELYDDIVWLDATAYLQIDMGGGELSAPMGVIVQRRGSFTRADAAWAQGEYVVGLNYDSSGVISSSTYILINGTRLDAETVKEMFGNYTTILTIIHHPFPERN